MTNKTLKASKLLSASRAMSTSWGIVAPHVRARNILETQDDIQHVTGRNAAAKPATGAFIIASNPSDDSNLELAGGVSAVWSGGLSGFVEAQTIVGLSNVQLYGLAAGVRLEF